MTKKQTKPVPTLAELVPMEKWSAPECELEVLGAVLADGEGLAPTLCALLADSDYYNPDHRRVAQAIRDLVERKVPVEIGTVARILLTANPPAKHIDFTRYTRSEGSSASVPFYCQEILDASAIRAMLNAMYLGMGADLDVNEMRDALTKAADIAKARGSTVRNVYTAARDEVAKIEARLDNGNRTNGIPTGWRRYDDMTGGLFPGDVTLVGARPSVGKTAFGLQLALHVSNANYRVLFVSLEMSESGLMQRILANGSGIESKEIRCGPLNKVERIDLKHARDRLEGKPLDIDDRAGLRMREIHAVAKRIPEGGGIVILDYIGLVKPEDQRVPREQQVARISAAIKAAAKDTKIPWVVLTQLRRLEPGRKGNPVPTMQDLRESGSLEQDADVVVLLHRDDYGQVSGPVSRLDAIIAKHRNGTTGIVPLIYCRDTQRIEEESR